MRWVRWGHGDRQFCATGHGRYAGLASAKAPYDPTFEPTTLEGSDLTPHGDPTGACASGVGRSSSGDALPPRLHRLQQFAPRLVRPEAQRALAGRERHGRHVGEDDAVLGDAVALVLAILCLAASLSPSTSAPGPSGRSIAIKVAPVSTVPVPATPADLYGNPAEILPLARHGKSAASDAKVSRAPIPAITSGVASWYDAGPGLYAAMHGYRDGTNVHIKVCAKDRCITVPVVTQCQICRWKRGSVLVDLSPAAFRYFAPLPVGLVNVTVEW